MSDDCNLAAINGVAARRKVLILATRDPRGRATGRKMVLRTIMRSCADLGFDVHVVVFGRTGEVDVPLTPHERFEFLPRPDLWRVLLNLLTQALRGALSLNECLYFSPRVL